MRIDALDLSAGTVYTNDNLFNRGLLYCGNIKIFSVIFSGLIMIATLLCCCGVLKIFYHEYGEKLGILMSCGLQRRKVLYIIAIQILLFTVSGGIISVLGGTVIYNYLSRILYPDIPSAGYAKSFRFLMIWFILLYLFLLLLFILLFAISEQRVFFGYCLRNNFLQKRKRTGKVLAIT
ncbi:MAG: FtsX-like permease family protein [Ruminococcus sp.]